MDLCILMFVAQTMRTISLPLAPVELFINPDISFLFSSLIERDGTSLVVLTKCILKSTAL